MGGCSPCCWSTNRPQPTAARRDVARHVEYLERHHRDETFLLSGPAQSDHISEVILAVGWPERVEQLTAEDPLVVAGMATYEIVAVDPVNGWPTPATAAIPGPPHRRDPIDRPILAASTGRSAPVGRGLRPDSRELNATRLISAGMQMRRMNREQFFGKLETHDEDRLAKVLWNLYWRGSASMRARIEAEIDPGQHERDKDASITAVDPDKVLAEVRDFVSLARSGAYLGGDRRVSPKERTRWRFTFRRLVTEAQDALRTDESDAAAAAVAELIDLACATREHDYFRSEDPVEAARFVVSDAAALLWSAVRDRHGLSTFAQRSAPQLIRWASPHGWTRSGWGPLSEKETSLAVVLAGTLRTPEMWIEFADRYLDALDDAAHTPVRRRGTWRREEWDQARRTAALADWHLLLLDKLTDYEADDQLTSLATHPALAGPELTYLQARLAHRRGDTSRARELVHDCLQELPGHQQFLDFATEIGAGLPPHALEISKQRESTQTPTS